MVTPPSYHVINMYARGFNISTAQEFLIVHDFFVQLRSIQDADARAFGHLLHSTLATSHGFYSSTDEAFNSSQKDNYIWKPFPEHFQ